MPREVMDTEEAAKYLSLHPESLRLFARRGKVPAAKLGRHWRFRKVELDAWLAAGGDLAGAAQGQLGFREGDAR